MNNYLQMNLKKMIIKPNKKTFKAKKKNRFKTKCLKRFFFIF